LAVTNTVLGQFEGGSSAAFVCFETKLLWAQIALASLLSSEGATQVRADCSGTPFKWPALWLPTLWKHFVQGYMY